MGNISIMGDTIQYYDGIGGIPLPYIISTGIAKPPYRIHQSEAKPFIRDLFADIFSDIDRLLLLFENTQIATRHFCVPLEWFRENHTFQEKNALYIDHATSLSIQALQSALQSASLDLGDLHHLFFVSTTGLSTPSLDARILNELKAQPQLKRTPIWGLGCAGGAAGLSRAFDYVSAYPEQMACIVAVELCGLTFQRNDLTKSNLVATSLFADGAAAVIVAGDKAKIQSGVRIKNTRSTLWPDSLDVMGWDFSSSGFHVIFSRDIPTFVQTEVTPDIRVYLSEQGISSPDHFIFHPGGKKVLEAYEESLKIPPGKLDLSEKILRENGNMSSCTVLYVLDEFLREKRIGSGEIGLISALGPGFSSELLLLEGGEF